VKNSASFDTKIVSLPIFSGYDPYLSYIYYTIYWAIDEARTGLFSGEDKGLWGVTDLVWGVTDRGWVELSRERLGRSSLILATGQGST